MPRLSEEKRAELRAKFKKFDTSGDGKLDYKEMSSLLRRGNATMTDVQLRALFNGVDTNKDGRVDFDEFVAYIYSGTKDASEEPAPPEAPEDVRSVFETFANGANMEGTEFAKLCRDSHLIGPKLSALDADMIFTKVVAKGKRAIQYPEFLKALVMVSQKTKMDIHKLYAQVGDSAPINKGTKADAVRFHDDKNTYTGTKRHSHMPGAEQIAMLRPPNQGSRQPSASPVGSRQGSRQRSNSAGGLAEIHENKGIPEEDLPPVPTEEEPDWNMLTNAFFDHAGKSDDLDGREFSKLCGDCGLYDSKFTKRDVDIIFAKVLFKSERRITFGQFIDALKLISEKKEVAPYFVHRAVLKTGGPVYHATKADAVRFHDDKSTYTGKHAVKK